ncbi:MAG: hypothetical protein KKG60_00305 [Nanoarchaeota archaeon]|nr:hypothetical protein [Nanoarchaeota archaeon]
MSKEDIILFKAVTRRERDTEDIKDIIQAEKTIDWEYIVDEAIKQKNNNPWILIDLEEVLQEIRKVTFIQDKYFQKIYKAQELSKT